MTKLEKLYSIMENSRDAGVKLPKGVIQCTRGRPRVHFYQDCSDSYDV